MTRKEERNKGTKKKKKKKRQETNRMALAVPYLSIIILNVNRFNSPIKKEWPNRL